MDESTDLKEVALPTEAELAILRVIWNRGPCTVREVHEILLERGTGYTTTLKQMQVMAERGMLVRNERYRSHVYEARETKERTQARLTRSFLERAFDGSATRLVLGALSAKPISSSEIDEIREMLKQFEEDQA